MFSRVHFSSASYVWSTPEELFDALDKEFHFDLDVCATKENAKCVRYLTEYDDALSIHWDGTAFWCNPPYGRGIEKWVSKAYIEALVNRAVSVLLLPSRTDTKWFHDFCIDGEIRFIRGRLHFNNSKDPAPFPSMVVVFDFRKKE